MPELHNLPTILLMGAVTYAVRAGGLVLVKRVRLSPFLEAWIRNVPGAVFAAICAPMVLQAGPPGWAAAAVTLAVARRFGNFLLAMLAGVAAVVLLRLVLPAFPGLGPGG